VTVTYRAISDYFLKLNVAFFSHWRLEAHIPLHATPNIGGDIPIDVPTNQNISGDTSPAGLTPMSPQSNFQRGFLGGYHRIAFTVPDHLTFVGF